ncbi:MAG: hypothetical protein AB8B69_24090 [Chitinophagales bacterium]
MHFPFNKPLYIKALVGVALGLFALFTVGIRFFDYELTEADPMGATITTPILAYLLHLLWMVWKEEV